MQSNSELPLAKLQDVLCIVRRDIQMKHGFKCATARRIFERKALECPCISLDVQTRVI
jgi:hypothetical protein